MDKKSGFSKFAQGKGFYLALTICLIGAGTAAFVAVDKTISAIDENNQSVTDNFTPPLTEEAGKEQSGVSKAPASSSTSSSSSQLPPISSSQPSKAPSSSSVQTPAANSQASSFVLPIKGAIITPYSKGELVKNETLNEWRTHDGIDIKAEKNAQVLSVCDGTIVSVANDPLWGNVVEIEHHDKITSKYAGLAKDVLVKKGDKVKSGQPIGAIGGIESENLLDSHLHFEMKKDGKYVDPVATMGKK